MKRASRLVRRRLWFLNFRFNTKGIPYNTVRIPPHKLSIANHEYHSQLLVIALPVCRERSSRSGRSACFVAVFGG